MFFHFIAGFLIIVWSSNVAGQNCLLPTQTEIESQISALLLNSDAGNTGAVTLTSPVQYTCQTQGNSRDTYNSLSIIASYTQTQVGSQTRHFQLQCSGKWEPSLSDGLDPPPTNYQSLSLRTDCYQCRDLGSLGLTDERHCRPCNPTCLGSGRCPSFGTCCSYFATDGSCTNDCTVSDGINYAPSGSPNFTCSCNLTCDPGNSPDTNCTTCLLTDICEYISPCQNGGICTLLSSPDNYTCNCADTAYEGANCTVCSLNCDDGFISNDNCTWCILSDICASSNNPCQNGGTCTLQSPPDNYTCDCRSGFTGNNCSLSVCNLTCNAGYIPNSNYNCTQCVLNDTCAAGNPCQNGGNCTLNSSPHDYTCNCDGNFDGRNCTDCSLDCQNGGSSNIDCSSCACPIGYTGPTCAVTIDYCSSDSCGIYGSSCTRNTSNIDGYTCACHEGWTGKNCQDCSINFCQQCSGTPPMCQVCIPGYDVDSAGRSCSLANLCSFMPCRNNGTCIGSPGSYECQCPKPWIGTNCTQCDSGYGLRGNICVSCDKDCLLCSANVSICTQCVGDLRTNSAGQCITTGLPTSTLIWIIVGCLLGALLIIAIIVATVMGFVRCAGSYNNRQKVSRNAFKAANSKVADNPLYVSHEDVNKVINEEENYTD